MRTRVFSMVVVFILGVVAGKTPAVSGQVDRANLPSVPTVTITTDTAGRVASSSETTPVTLSNADVGLRVVGQHNGRVLAKLVAKVNGEWVEVQLAPQDSFAGR